jgi:hypothetical protein
MKRYLILLLILAFITGVFGCGGGGSGSPSLPPGENPNKPSVVKLMPSHYIAQTNSMIALHAKVLDGNGKPLPNISVKFTNLSEPFGVIQSFLKIIGIKKYAGVLSAKDVKTNKYGIATVKLTSTTEGFATIQAEVNTGYGIIRDQKTVYFAVNIRPGMPTLTLHVDDGDGTYDEVNDYMLFKSSNDGMRILKAKVLDGYGRPISLSKVKYVSDSADVTFPDGDEKYTNTDGEAFVQIKVKPSFMTSITRVINIYAVADVGAYGIVSLLLSPLEIDSINVTANPSVVAPNANSSIKAIIKMKNSVSVPDGISVNFETTCGFIPPFSQTTNGVADNTFTAPSTPGQCVITARAGGISGNVTVNVTTNLTVQPSSQTINGIAGGTASFTIYGGVAPYTVTSNNTVFQPSPSTVNASGESFSVNVAANSPNVTVQFTVRDSVGTTVTATLQITGVSLSVFPNTVTVDGAEPDDTVTFTIYGGSAPYTVFSNKPTLYAPVPSTVDTEPYTFNVTIPAGSPEDTVVFTIRDSVGATTTATINIITVAPQPLKIIPTVQTIANPVVGNTANFTVLGGKAPYKAYSNNPALVTVPEDVTGNTVTATVAGVPTQDTTINITVYDSLGSSITAQLILDLPPILPLTVLPNSINVTSRDASQEALFTIFGGVQPYSVFSNNLLFPPVMEGATQFKVTIPPHTPTAVVTYVVRDLAGSSTTATLTITGLAIDVLPRSQTINGAPGGTVIYRVYGGVPPYTIVSSYPLIAYNGTPGNGVWSVSNAGDTFSVTVSPDTHANTITLSIMDSISQTSSATLNIIYDITDFYVLPAGATIPIDGSMAFTIYGGTLPFEIFINNPIVDIFYDTSIDPRSFTVVGNEAGSVTITIRDSVGRIKDVSVTIE